MEKKRHLKLNPPKTPHLSLNLLDLFPSNWYVCMINSFLSAATEQKAWIVFPDIFSPHDFSLLLSQASNEPPVSPYSATDEYATKVALEADAKHRAASEETVNLDLMEITNAIAAARKETDRILTVAIQAEPQSWVLFPEYNFSLSCRFHILFLFHFFLLFILLSLLNQLTGTLELHSKSTLSILPFFPQSDLVPSESNSTALSFFPVSPPWYHSRRINHKS